MFWRISLLIRYYHLFVLLKNWRSRIYLEKLKISRPDKLVLRNNIKLETAGSIKNTNDVFLEIYAKQVYLKYIQTIPKIVLDIGGHFGFFTVQIAKKFPKCKIITFEPSRKSFSILSDNVKNNDVKNVALNNFAVGAYEGEISFFESEFNECSSLFNNYNSGHDIQVQITTLENIISINSIPFVDVLKIDCEGAEFELIDHNLNILSKTVKLILLEYHLDLRPDKRVSEDLVFPLESANFKVEVFMINDLIGHIVAKNLKSLS